MHFVLQLLQIRISVAQRMTQKTEN